MTRSDNVTSYLIRITQIRDQQKIPFMNGSHGLVNPLNATFMSSASTTFYQMAQTQSRTRIVIQVEIEILHK